MHRHGLVQWTPRAHDTAPAWKCSIGEYHHFLGSSCYTVSSKHYFSVVGCYSISWGAILCLRKKTLVIIGILSCCSWLDYPLFFDYIKQKNASMFPDEHLCHLKLLLINFHAADFSARYSSIYTTHQLNKYIKLTKKQSSGINRFETITPTTGIFEDKQ